MIKIMIVDDEKYVRKELIYFLEKHGDIVICCETGRGEEVQELIKKYNPDVIFLDIHLQTENGLALASEIQKMKKHPYLVLATAHSEYALEGFEVGVVDYLVKPFDQARINKCIERIKTLIDEKINTLENNLNNDNLKKIALQKYGKFLLIDLDNIYYLEYKQNDLYIYTEENEFLCKNLNLKKFIEIYGDKNFIRIHKSVVVNINYISEIIPWFNSTMKIHLKNMPEIEIFVSRSYLKKFKSIVKI